MTNEEKTEKPLSLKDGIEVEIDGMTYLKLDGDDAPEWKASPHGSEGDYDTAEEELVEEFAA